MIDVVFKMLISGNGGGHLPLDNANTFLRLRRPYEEILILNLGIDLDTIHHKPVVVDVLGKTCTGEQVQIEMQGSRQNFFRERALYDVARLHRSLPDTTLAQLAGLSIEQVAEMRRALDK